MPEYPPLPEGPIAPLLKKRPGGDGVVGDDPLRLHRRFQRIAEGGGNAPALEVLVDIQAVQLPRAVHVPKARESLPLHRHKGGVRQEGPAPLL